MSDSFYLPGIPRLAIGDDANNLEFVLFILAQQVPAAGVQSQLAKPVDLKASVQAVSERFHQI